MQVQDRFARLDGLPLRSIGNYSRSPAGAWHAVIDIFHHREMLSLLVRRDIKARYKDSALGFVWALVRPLTQLLIYYVFVGRILGASKGVPEFAIYVFTGLTAYTLFSEIVSSGTGSIVGNGGLIKKVYLPREVFPLASVGSALFNLMIQLGILLVATLVLGQFPWDWDFFYFIPATIVIITYGLAFALLLSALNVYLRDIAYLVEVVLMVLMWSSPVIYGYATVEKALHGSVLLQIYTDNPVTLAVLGYSRAFWIAGHDTVVYPSFLLLRLGIAFVIGLVLLFLFQRVFSRLQGNFAQEL
jgi:ABC-2 type transport system permease protein